MFASRIFTRLAFACALLAATCAGARAQQREDYIRYDRFESEREDRKTGGHIERAEFEPGQIGRAHV